MSEPLMRLFLVEPPTAPCSEGEHHDMDLLYELGADVPAQAVCTICGQPGLVLKRARDLEPLAVVLRNARVQFWMCPVEAHQQRFVGGRQMPTVEWRDNVAHCLTDGCEHSSLD